MKYLRPVNCSGADFASCPWSHPMKSAPVKSARAPQVQRPSSSVPRLSVPSGGARQSQRPSSQRPTSQRPSKSSVPQVGARQVSARPEWRALGPARPSSQRPLQGLASLRSASSRLARLRVGVTESAPVQGPASSGQRPTGRRPSVGLRLGGRLPMGRRQWTSSCADSEVLHPPRCMPMALSSIIGSRSTRLMAVRTRIGAIVSAGLPVLSASVRRLLRYCRLYDAQ